MTSYNFAFTFVKVVASVPCKDSSASSFTYQKVPFEPILFDFSPPSSLLLGSLYLSHLLSERTCSFEGIAASFACPLVAGTFGRGIAWAFSTSAAFDKDLVASFRTSVACASSCDVS